MKGASNVKSIRLPGLTSTFAAERAAMMGPATAPGLPAIAPAAFRAFLRGCRSFRVSGTFFLAGLIGLNTEPFPIDDQADEFKTNFRLNMEVPAFFHLH